MNRSFYFNYIDQRLDFLAYRIKQRGKINLLDLNIYSETFFADMINLLMNYKLKNLNIIKQNVEGIDLIDHTNKIVIQVSSTCTKAKVENSLKKEIFETYKEYRFKFISISNEASSLRTKTYVNPHGVTFEPQEDIIDVISIKNIVLSLGIDKQKEFFEFIKKELGQEVDIVKVDSNLATIINIIANENLDNIIDSPEINSFQINNKIVFNNLEHVEDTINDYKIYYSKLNEKYEEFNKQGANKSISIFRVLGNQYAKLSAEGIKSHELFYAIIDKVISIITGSKNYVEIPYEELEMCVHILVVDAFIRCKIFKNPEDYHVIT